MEKSSGFYVKWLNCYLHVYVVFIFVSWTKFQILFYRGSRLKNLFAEAITCLQLFVDWKFYFMFQILLSMVTLRALHLLKVRQAGLVFIPNTTFVCAGLVNFIAIGARWRRVAAGLMETTRRGSTSGSQMGLTMSCDQWIKTATLPFRLCLTAAEAILRFRRNLERAHLQFQANHLSLKSYDLNLKNKIPIYIWKSRTTSHMLSK